MGHWYGEMEISLQVPLESGNMWVSDSREDGNITRPRSSRCCITSLPCRRYSRRCWSMIECLHRCYMFSSDTGKWRIVFDCLETVSYHLQYHHVTHYSNLYLNWPKLFHIISRSLCPNFILFSLKMHSFNHSASVGPTCKTYCHWCKIFTFRELSARLIDGPHPRFASNRLISRLKE